MTPDEERYGANHCISQCRIQIKNQATLEPQLEYQNWAENEPINSRKLFVLENLLWFGKRDGEVNLSQIVCMKEIDGHGLLSGQSSVQS